MPVRIIKDFSTPPNMPAIRVEHVPRETRPDRPRPLGTIDFDAISGRFRTVPKPVEATFYVGLDLGQAADWTAVAVVQPVCNGFDAVMLERIRDRPYPSIVADVQRLMQTPPLAGAAQLVVDATGVGRPVLDMVRASGLCPIALTITGGDRVTGHRRAPRVPKRDLINVLLVAFQSGTLRIAAGLPHAQTLTRELAEMRRKISTSGHDSYGAWRDGEHDDLVLALAMAIWSAERRNGRVMTLPITDAPTPPHQDRPAPAPKTPRTSHDFLDHFASKIGANHR